MSKLLLTSIHDVSPRFEMKIEQLIAAIHGATGSSQFAMLVVPDHWDQAPIAADKGFQRKLRAWSDAGVEMFVHGWRHRDDAPQGFKGRHMTAGEGEFLNLDAAEATRRMRDGRALIEDIIGRPAAGFIAPAWLYGNGAQEALRTLDMPVAEDHFRVWRPGDGEVLAKGPVISWASRSRSRIASSLAFAGVARIALKPQRVVRVALHPGDTTVPALMTSIDRTLRSFAYSHTPSGYRGLQ
ncbi:MAG: polysaccharide deacetylase family protein [Proteobacteria bacterium]|nr:polysaccharide deacetylase family protein [Pseudomonadota bacterium]